MKNSAYQKEPLKAGPLLFDNHDVYSNQKDLILTSGFSCLRSEQGFPASDLSSHVQAELIFSVDIPPDQVTRQKYGKTKKEKYLNL